jgi:hypothetical protein
MYSAKVAISALLLSHGDEINVIVIYQSDI